MPSKYCVYLTTYSGSLLPPFYIGSTIVSKINKGYRGSPSSVEFKHIWRREKIHNPHLFKTKIICTFDTREAAAKKESYLQQKLNVHINPLYINKAIWRNGHLNYKGLPSPEAYKRAADKRRGVKHGPHSDIVKRKISLTKKNQKVIHSKEYREKMSIACSGRNVSQVTREKLSKVNKGRKQTAQHIRNNALATSKYVYRIHHPSGFIEDIILIREWCQQRGISVESFKSTVRGWGKYKEFKVEMITRAK